MKDAVLCGAILAAIGDNLRHQAQHSPNWPYYEVRDPRHVVIDGIVDLVELTKAIAERIKE